MCFQKCKDIINELTLGRKVANLLARAAAAHSVLRPNSMLVRMVAVDDHLRDFLVQDILDMDTCGYLPSI
jgi:hypothetical protein